MADHLGKRLYSGHRSYNDLPPQQVEGGRGRPPGHGESSKVLHYSVDIFPNGCPQEERILYLREALETCRVNIQENYDYLRILEGQLKGLEKQL